MAPSAPPPGSATEYILAVQVVQRYNHEYWLLWYLDTGIEFILQYQSSKFLLLYMQHGWSSGDICVTEMDRNVLNLFIQWWVLFISSVTVVFDKGQQLVYTHTFLFIPTWYYLMIPNTCVTFLLTQCTIHEYNTGNDVSKFMHLNRITLSYYSSPKHKSLIPKYLIHFSHFCTQ